MTLIRFPLLAASGGIALLALAGCGTEPVASGSAPATTTPAPIASTSTATTKEPCPVDAATLQKASTLPAGWRIDGKTIECAEGWAQAEAIAPTPAEQGDGVTLFRFDKPGGRWVEVEEGSAIDCRDRGIPRSAAGKLSVCIRPY